MLKRVKLKGWTVDLTLDEDGHLGVYIAHEDGTEIHPCNADIGDEREWAERFTTQKIEDDYNISVHTNK